MPRFRKSKAPSALALDGAFAPKFGMVVMKEADPNSICRGLSLTEAALIFSLVIGLMAAIGVFLSGFLADKNDLDVYGEVAGEILA